MLGVFAELLLGVTKFEQCVCNRDSKWNLLVNSSKILYDRCFVYNPVFYFILFYVFVCCEKDGIYVCREDGCSFELHPVDFITV